MTSKSIGVAIVAKNEEALIGRCLESVKWADEIIVCDSGSQDRTVEIARKYTDKILLDYIWNDDFSSIQNHCKKFLTTSAVLSIDCDEVLLSTEEEVRLAVSKMLDVCRVKMVAEGEAQNTFYFGRIFRNTPEIYWCQPIHKHLNIPGDGEDCGEVSIMYGWSPAHAKDPDRSLRMLEKTVEDEGASSCRNLYYLGREYWYKQRYKECTDTLGRYVKVGHWAAEMAEAFLVMSQAFAAQENYSQAQDAVLQAIKLNPEFKEAIEWMASIVRREHSAQWRRMARTANNNDVMWIRTATERVNETIFLSVHHDDESLFGAFTLLRVKPLVIVCTSSHIQPHRGDLGCTDEIRTKETIEAMKIAGCPVVFLGIPDTELTEEILRERLKGITPDRIYVPAIQGGNWQHDLVGKVGMELFGNRCERYLTYTKTELYTTGNWEIKPTPEELELKEKMLSCYKSQLNLASTMPHFKAVKGQSEWLL